MAVTKGPSGKSWEDKPTSALSKQKFLTYPEKRIGAGPYSRGVDQAAKLVNTLGDKGRDK